VLLLPQVYMKNILFKLSLAIASFVVYAMFFNYKFAIIAMVTIAVHELGHLWMMREFDIPNKGFYFVPFIGAVSVGKGYHRTLSEKAWVSLMGPFWGYMLSLILCYVAVVTGNHTVAIACVYNSMLTAFNLLPFSITDGGSILKCIMAKRGEDELLTIMERRFFVLTSVSVFVLCILMAISLGISLDSFLRFLK
jgi:Zn-dependent protease